MDLIKLEIMLHHKELCVLLISAAIPLGWDMAYADITIKPSEMNRHSLDIITVSGLVEQNSLHALIVMKYPDHTTQEHTALVGSDGVFRYFLNPDDTFPSGTYLVSVYSKGIVDTVAFNIYDDSERSFNFVIPLGSSTKSCDGCIHPAKTSVFNKSVLTWSNDDSTLHDIVQDSKEFVGILKPGESKSIHATTTGTHSYHCTIHPWIYGEITILGNDFDFPVREIIFENMEKPDISPEVEFEILETAGIIPEIIPETARSIPGTTPEIIPCDSCFGGIITKVVDGNSLEIDNKRIRLALIDTPERGETGYGVATDFLKSMCPVGSTAFYSIDKGQSAGQYGMINAELFCGGVSVNQNILEKNYKFIDTISCDFSDFASSVWAAIPCRAALHDVINTDDLPETLAAVEIPDKDIAETPLEIPSDFITLEHDYSNPFDPDSYSITIPQIIIVSCVGVVLIILLKSKKKT